MASPVTTSTSTSTSASVEDYLKAIYSLGRGGERVATTELAERLGFAASSASAMVGRLAETGLLDYVPYAGVRLTEEGERQALRVIRRHRLLESFLARSLDIPWDRVHLYAEQLEHAASDELIDLIAAKLGDPTVDPHGDPIPTRELTIEESGAETLADLEPGQSATLIRVSDSDPEMLRYLAEREIGIDEEIEMLDRQPFDGPCEIRVGARTEQLPLALARAMRIRRGPTRPSARGRSA
ncbi:MAG: metal-dependent transcriptional regulator [Solirubrobacterales bacterium]